MFKYEREPHWDRYAYSLSATALLFFSFILLLKFLLKVSDLGPTWIDIISFLVWVANKDIFVTIWNDFELLTDKVLLTVILNVTKNKAKK